METQLKALLVKAWKKESLELNEGRHYFDDVLVVRLSGSVEKHADQMINSTISIPLIPTMALLLEKCGVNKEQSLKLLREAISEAMTENVKEDTHIQKCIDDVQAAIKSVKNDLIAQLPKMHRSGKVDCRDLEVTVMPMSAVNELAVA